MVEWVKRKQTAGEFELYLDSLDELAWLDEETPPRKGLLTRREWVRRQFLGLTGRPVLLTARLTVPLKDLLNCSTRLRMVPLEPQQVREYLDRYFDSQLCQNGEELESELRQRLRMSPGPRQLVRLPLLLAVLCELRRENLSAQFPTTRTALLRLGVMGLLERGDRRRGFENPRVARNEDKLAVLYEVAWRFHEGEPVPMTEGELRGVLAEHRGLIRRYAPADEEALLREFLEEGILVPRGVDEQSRERCYGFLLRSFHEYCLAGWIAHRSAGCGDRSTFVGRVQGGCAEWGRPDWRLDFRPHVAVEWSHIWPLVSGHLKERAGWLLALDDNDYVAAPVASEAPLDCEERIVLLNRLVARLGNRRTSQKNRRRCSWALGQLGGSEAAVALGRCLNDSDTPVSVREMCAWALHELGGPEAVMALGQCLYNSDTPVSVRGACDWVLSQLGGPEADVALEQDCLDSDSLKSVREECERYLGKLAGPDARAAIVQCLLDSGAPESVRWECALRLGVSGRPEAYAALVQCLLDSGTPESVREECACVLCGFGGPKALAALVVVRDAADTPRRLRLACENALLEWRE